VTTLLLANSAWVRLGDPALPSKRTAELADALEAGQIGTCLPFLLEAGYSARSARDHDQLLAELGSLPHFQIDEEVEQRSLRAQGQLARIGHHRVPPVDLLIAAVADRYGLAVLHYDRDYDVLAEKTDLSFGSERLSSPGTL
jgi:predicted nucleic acid-binding protein